MMLVYRQVECSGPSVYCPKVSLYSLTSQTRPFKVLHPACLTSSDLTGKRGACACADWPLQPRWVSRRD
jgi:hypothetical protein